MRAPLINIDSGLNAVEKSEVTAEVIDTYISMYSFGAIDVEKRINHLLELVTEEPLFWSKLVLSAKYRYWINNGNYGIVVFGANQDCGFTRSYRFKGPLTDVVEYSPVKSDVPWKRISSERQFLGPVDLCCIYFTQQYIGSHIIENASDTILA